jgi:hypothetical protein
VLCRTACWQLDEFCNWLKGMSILGASFIPRATMVSIT